MLFRFRPKFLSIQLSDNVIRSVSVRGRKLKYFSETSVSEPLFKKGTLQPQAASDAVKTLLEKAPNMSGNNVVLSLPEDKTFTKVFELNSAVDPKDEEAILREIEQHVPLRIQDMYVDWQVVVPVQNKTFVAFTASEKKFVDDFLSVFDPFDITILALEPESHALLRALLPKHLFTKAMCLVEITEAHSTYVIQENGIVYFSRRVQNSSWKSFYKDIRESCEFFSSHLSPQASAIEQILFCGTHTPTDQDSLQQIEKSLRYPVALADPWNTVSPATGKKINQPSAYALSVAVGLALR